MIAREYFVAAQEVAPDNPHVIYNLAVACDRDGRDLEAAYWYRAYLAAAPDAENADAVRKAGSVVEARASLAAFLLWEQARWNHEEDLVLIEGMSATLALSGQLDEIVAWSRVADRGRENILVTAMETFGQMGDADALEALVTEMSELESSNVSEGFQVVQINENTQFDRALDDWLEKAQSLSSALRERTQDYVLDGVISGEGDDVGGLTEAAANLTGALLEVQLTARYWRQRRQ